MLKRKFKALCSQFSNNEKLVQQLWQEVKEQHSHPSRHYHTLPHLIGIYKALETVKLSVVMEFAIFYHDIVYDVLKQDNEEQSAGVAKISLTFLAVDAKTVEKVCQLIEETKTHEATCKHNALFLDADLAILGSNAQKYKQYCEKVRKEYALYNNENYNKGRKKVLKHFLEKERVYVSEFFHKKYEKQAKQNILIEYNSLI